MYDISFVGTNDMGHKRLKKLIPSYKTLIQKIKTTGKRCIVPGILLPRLGSGQKWGSKALCVNEMVRKLYT